MVDDRGYPVAGATIEVVGVDAEGMPIDETTALADFREEHFEATLAGPAPLIPMGELGFMPGPDPRFAARRRAGSRSPAARRTAAAIPG